MELDKGLQHVYANVKNDVNKLVALKCWKQTLQDELRGWGKNAPSPCPASSHIPPFDYAHQGGWRGSIDGGGYKALDTFPRSEISWKNVHSHRATWEPLFSGWEVWVLPKASGLLSQPGALKEYNLAPWHCGSVDSCLYVCAWMCAQLKSRSEVK